MRFAACSLLCENQITTHVLISSHLMLFSLLIYIFQRELARISAEQRRKVAMDDDTASRLAAAEASMEKQLTRVNKEKVEVERAVADLMRAKDQLDAESKGNIGKPAALAGVLLFSVRAFLDFIAMSGGGIEAESHLTAALIQGAVALACGAYLLFTK
jgi:hypothetical protein